MYVTLLENISEEEQRRDVEFILSLNTEQLEDEMRKREAKEQEERRKTLAELGVLA